MMSSSTSSTTISHFDPLTGHAARKGDPRCAACPSGASYLGNWHRRLVPGKMVFDRGAFDEIVDILGNVRRVIGDPLQMTAD